MEIYLVRHTTPNVERGICYGFSDIALTDDFPSEAKRVLEKIPQHVQTIYTSPLIRCNVLAEFLSQATGCRVVKDIRLKELNFGDWEMRRWDDVNKADLMKWMNNYEVARCPNGESYTDLVMRVQHFMEDIKHVNGRIVVVTHAGVIKAFYAIINRLSLSAAMDLKIGYGEIVRMNYGTSEIQQ